MHKIISTVFFVIVFGVVQGQEVLTTDKAIEIALENNYGIRLAANMVEIAQNNASILNTGELPSFALNSNAGYGATGSELRYNAEGVPGSSTWLVHGLDVSASVSGSYLIYNFGNRELKKQKLQETLKLAGLEQRKTIENSIYAVLANYYYLAQIGENLVAQEEVLRISRDRINRIQLQNQFGRNNRLAILNAEVDMNRDSIDLMNLIQQLDNQKRDLNFLLGRAVDNSFSVDPSINFIEGLTLNQLLEEALSNNVDLSVADQDIAMSRLDMKINENSLKPAITANGSLGLLGAANSPKASIKNQFVTDFALGVGLSWNIFDGGYKKVRDGNLKIMLDNQEILREQKSAEIKLNIHNAWETFQNQLYLMKVEERNMETAQLNFERTSEQFKLGQVSSIEFRQAQLNQLSAQLSYNRAKLNAKLSELTLLLNSGRILEGI